MRYKIVLLTFMAVLVAGTGLSTVNTQSNTNAPPGALWIEDASVHWTDGSMEYFLDPLLGNPVKLVSSRTGSDFDSGSYTSTGSDMNDNSGDLRLGYDDSMSNLMAYWKMDRDLDTLKQTDGFEDGNINEYSKDTGSFTVQSNEVKVGNEALETSDVDATLYSDSGLSRYPEVGSKISYWVRSNQGTGSSTFSASNFHFGIQSASEDNLYKVRILHHKDNFYLRKKSGGSASTLDEDLNVGGDFDANEWYKVVIRWTEQGIQVSLYNKEGELKSYLHSDDSEYSSNAISWEVQNDNGATIWFDDLRHSSLRLKDYAGSTEPMPYGLPDRGKEGILGTNSVNIDPGDRYYEDSGLSGIKPTSGSVTVSSWVKFNDPLNEDELIDSFEDGSLSEYSGDTGNGLYITHEKDDDEVPISGSRMLTDVGNEGDFALIHSSSGLDNYFGKGETANFYMRVPGDDDRSRVLFGLQDSSNHYRVSASPDEANGRTNFDVNRFESGSGNFLDNEFSNEYIANEWVRIKIVWDDGTLGGSNNDIRVNFYTDGPDDDNSFDNKVAGVTANDATFSSETGIGFKSENGNVRPTFWDLAKSSVNNEIILNANSVDPGYSYEIFRTEAEGIAFSTEDGSYAESRFGPGPEKIQDTEWHHVAGTYNGTHTRVYIDGEVAKEKINSNNPMDGDIRDLEIGSRKGIQAKGEFGDFRLDEIMLFNAALTQSEIKNLYLTGQNGVFDGEYDRSISVPAGETPGTIQIDSKVPEDTAASVTVSNTNGESKQFSLDSRSTLKNYSIPFTSEGSNLDLKFELNTSDLTRSPEISSFNVWRGDQSSTGASGATWIENSGFNWVDEVGTERVFNGERVLDSVTAVVDKFTKSDYDSGSSYNGTSPDGRANSGDLSIGYRNGIGSDDLVGYWKFESSTGSAFKDSSYNSWFSTGNTPDVAITNVKSDLEQDKLSDTTVELTSANDGFGTYDMDVSLYEFTVSGTSWTQNNIGSGGGAIEGIVTADIDGDGDKDIVYGDAGNQNVEYLENDGSGGGWSATKIGNQDVESVSVGDVDGDGDLDVVGGGNNDNIYFFENDNGDGSSWTRHSIGSAGLTVRSVALGDMDGDGDLDIASADYGADAHWYENDGSNSGWTERTIGATNGNAWTIALADIDNDGDMDAVTGDSTWIKWHENDGASNPSFTTDVIDNTINTEVWALGIADIDGDGNLDVIHSDANNDLKLHRNTGGNGDTWSTSTLGSHPDGPSIRTIQIADIDMDGDQDILTGADGGSSGDIVWFENDGTYGSFPSSDIGDAGDDGHYGLAMADLDYDGVIETVSGEDDSSGNIRLWDPASISATKLGSSTVSFSNSNGGTKTTQIDWTPDSVDKNLLVRLGETGENTEIFSMNDETAGAVGNEVIQSTSGSGTLTDYSGNGNDEISSQGTTRGQEGVFNTDSIDFDGAKSEIEIADDPSLEGMSSLTVSTWVKFDESENKKSNFIVVKQQAGPNLYSLSRSETETNSNDERIRFAGDGIDNIFGNDEDSIRDTEWHHVVGTTNSSENRLYVDGELIKTGSGGTVGTSSNELTIGGYEQVDVGAEAKIDEMRIYKRDLSYSEVQNLYFYGRDGEFNADYSLNSIGISSGSNPFKLEADVNKIPEKTSLTFKVDHSGGETDVITAKPGRRNYTLDIDATGGNVDVKVDFSSTDVTQSAVLNGFKIWEGSEVSTGAAGSAWIENGNLHYVDETGTERSIS